MCASFVTVPESTTNDDDAWNSLTSASAGRSAVDLPRRWWPGWPIPMDFIRDASQTAGSTHPGKKPPEQPAGRAEPPPEPPGRLAAKAEPGGATDGNQATVATASEPSLPDKALDPTGFNIAAERRAIELMHTLVGQATSYVAGYLAFELNISTATARRYIEKFTVHPAAPFYVERGVLKKR